MHADLANLVALVGVLAAVAPAAAGPQLADGRAPVRVDELGDPLPKGAFARLGTARLHDGFAVSSLCFTPDGKRILSTSDRSRVRVWSALTGEGLGDYTDVRDVARSVEATADGRRVVVGGYFTDAAYTLDAASGELLHHVGDLPNFRESRTCDPESEVRAVALSPDGRLGALPALPKESHWSSFGDHPAVRLFRIEDGREVGRLFGEDPRNRFVTARFSPDGKLVAAGDDRGGLHVWSLNSLQPVFEKKAHKRGVFALSFSPDSATLASSGRDGLVVVQDAHVGEELRRWRAADSEVLGLQFTPDGRGLLSCSRARLVLWDPASGREVREYVGHGRSLRSMALSADGRRLAAGSRSGSIRLWDVPTGSPVLPSEGHRAGVAAVRFSPDGKQLASAGRDRLLLWDVAGRRRVAAFGEYGDDWSDARFAPGRPVLLGLDRDNGVRFWDLRTEREVRRVGGGRERVLQFDQSPDGRLLATRHGSGAIDVWDAQGGTHLRRLPGRVHGEHGGPRFLEVSPDGRSAVTGGYEQPCEVWDLETGAARPAGGGTDDCECAAFAPGGRLFAEGDGGIVGIGPGPPLPVVRLGERRQRTACAAVSPDGRTLATADRGDDIMLWELASGRLRRRFRPVPDSTEAGVRCLVFSPDGKTLASGHEDTSILLWDAAGSAEGQEPTLQAVESAWDLLAGQDAERAGRAMGLLIRRADSAVAFLGRTLAPVRAVGARELSRLVGDLDHPRFAAREQASRDLARSEHAALPYLQGALRGGASEEARQRLGHLVDRLAGPEPPGDLLQRLRAVEVLEHIGTPAAERLVRKLAAGAPDARLTEEAKSSLARWGVKGP